MVQAAQNVVPVAAAAGFVGGSLEIVAGIATIVVDPFTTAENIATGMSSTYTTYSAKGGPLLGVMAVVNLHRAYEVATGTDILDGHKLSGDEVFDRSIEAAGAIGDLVLMGRGAALRYSGKAASAAGKTTTTAVKSTLDDAANKISLNVVEGSQVAPARFVRMVKPGETISNLIAEGKAATWVHEAEHAILSIVGNGRIQRVIVRGGRDGIQFFQRRDGLFFEMDGVLTQVRRVIGHTHPRATGPSQGDLDVIRLLGQRRSYIIEIGGEPGGTIIRPM